MAELCRNPKRVKHGRLEEHQNAATVAGLVALAAAFLDTARRQLPGPTPASVASPHSSAESIFSARAFSRAAEIM